MVVDAVTKDSKDFGGLVKVLDHKLLGDFATTYRLSEKVMATDVADYLLVSRSQVHFLETGQRNWTLKTLENYLEAVVELS